MDCQSLEGLPSGMVLHCRLSSEGWAAEENKYKKGPLVHKKQLRKIFFILATKGVTGWEKASNDNIEQLFLNQRNWSINKDTVKEFV